MLASPQEPLLPVIPPAPAVPQQAGAGAASCTSRSEEKRLSPTKEAVEDSRNPLVKGKALLTEFEESTNAQYDTVGKSHFYFCGQPPPSLLPLAHVTPSSEKQNEEMRHPPPSNSPSTTTVVEGLAALTGIDFGSRRLHRMRKPQHAECQGSRASSHSDNITKTDPLLSFSSAYLAHFYAPDANEAREHRLGETTKKGRGHTADNNNTSTNQLLFQSERKSRNPSEAHDHRQHLLSVGKPDGLPQRPASVVASPSLSPSPVAAPAATPQQMVTTTDTNSSRCDTVDFNNNNSITKIVTTTNTNGHHDVKNEAKREGEEEEMGDTDRYSYYRDVLREAKAELTAKERGECHDRNNNNDDVGVTVRSRDHPTSSSSATRKKEEGLPQKEAAPPSSLADSSSSCQTIREFPRELPSAAGHDHKDSPPPQHHHNSERTSPPPPYNDVSSDGRSQTKQDKGTVHTAAVAVVADHGKDRCSSRLVSPKRPTRAPPIKDAISQRVRAPSAAMPQQQQQQEIIISPSMPEEVLIAFVAANPHLFGSPPLLTPSSPSTTISTSHHVAAVVHLGMGAHPPHYVSSYINIPSALGRELSYLAKASNSSGCGVLPHSPRGVPDKLHYPSFFPASTNGLYHIVATHPQCEGGGAVMPTNVAMAGVITVGDSHIASSGPGTVDFSKSALHPYFTPTVERPRHMRHLPRGDPFKHTVGREMLGKANLILTKLLALQQLSWEQKRLVDLFNAHRELEGSMVAVRAKAAQKQFVIERADGTTVGEDAVTDREGAALLAAVGSAGVGAAAEVATAPSPMILALQNAISINYHQQMATVASILNVMGIVGGMTPSLTTMLPAVASLNTAQVVPACCATATLAPTINGNGLLSLSLACSPPPLPSAAVGGALPPRLSDDDPLLMQTTDGGEIGQPLAAKGVSPAAGSVAWWRSKRNNEVNAARTMGGGVSITGALGAALQVPSKKQRAPPVARLAAVDPSSLGIRERIAHKRAAEGINSCAHPYTGQAPEVVNTILAAERNRADAKLAEKAAANAHKAVIDEARALLEGLVGSNDNATSPTAGGNGKGLLDANTTNTDAAVAALLAVTALPAGSDGSVSAAVAELLQGVLKGNASSSVVGDNIYGRRNNVVAGVSGDGGVFGPSSSASVASSSPSPPLPPSSDTALPPSSQLPLPASPRPASPSLVTPQPSNKGTAGHDEKATKEAQPSPKKTTAASFSASSTASTAPSQVIAAAAPGAGKPVGVTSLVGRIPPPKPFRDRMRDALAAEEKAFETYRTKVAAAEAALLPPPPTDPNVVAAMMMLQASNTQTQLVLDRIRHALKNDAPPAEIKALMGTAMTIPTSLSASIGARLGPRVVEAMSPAVKVEYITLMAEHARQAKELEELQSLWKKAMKRERIAEAAANVTQNLTVMPPLFSVGAGAGGLSGLQAPPPMYVSGVNGSGGVPGAAFNTVMSGASGIGSGGSHHQTQSALTSATPPPPAMSLPKPPHGADPALYSKCFLSMSPEKGPKPRLPDGALNDDHKAGNLLPVVQGAFGNASSSPHQLKQINPAFVAYVRSMLRSEVQKLQGPNEPITSEQSAWIDQQVAIEIENLKNKQINELAAQHQQETLTAAITAINSHQLYMSSAKGYADQQQQLAILYAKHPELLQAALRHQHQKGPSSSSSAFLSHPANPNYYPDGAPNPVPPPLPSRILTLDHTSSTEGGKAAAGAAGGAEGPASVVGGGLYGAYPRSGNYSQPQQYNPFAFYAADNHHQPWQFPIPQGGHPPPPPPPAAVVPLGATAPSSSSNVGVYHSTPSFYPTPANDPSVPYYTNNRPPQQSLAAHDYNGHNAVRLPPQHQQHATSQLPPVAYDALNQSNPPKAPTQQVLTQDNKNNYTPPALSPQTAGVPDRVGANTAAASTAANVGSSSTVQQEAQRKPSVTAPPPLPDAPASPKPNPTGTNEAAKVTNTPHVAPNEARVDGSSSSSTKITKSGSSTASLPTAAVVGNPSALFGRQSPPPRPDPQKSATSFGNDEVPINVRPNAPPAFNLDEVPATPAAKKATEGSQASEGPTATISSSAAKGPKALPSATSANSPAVDPSSSKGVATNPVASTAVVASGTPSSTGGGKGASVRIPLRERAKLAMRAAGKGPAASLDGPTSAFDEVVVAVLPKAIRALSPRTPAEDNKDTPTPL